MADFEHWVVPRRKGIIAHLDENGLVEFKANTIGCGVRGRDLFNKMMQYFGQNANGLWGKWVSGTNLNTVNELTSQGVPLEQAITRTWTAKRARDAGFGEATLIKAEGNAGAYTDIVVQFTN